MKLDFKNKIKKLFSIWLNFISSENNFRFCTVIFLFCLISPLIFDFFSANLFFKIVIILCTLFVSCFLIFVFFLLKFANNKKKCIIYLIPILLIYSFTIFSYFNLRLNDFKAAVFGFFIAYMLFIGFYNIISLFTKKTFLSEQFLVIMLTIVLLFLCVAYVNDVSNNKDGAEMLYKISVGLLYLIIISMLIHYYLYVQSKKGVGQKIIGIIFWSCLVIFSIPYYLRWWDIPSEDFEMVLNIYVEMIGGSITLIGVAWTIKKGNDDRKNERKLSVKPLIYSISHRSDYNYKQQVYIEFYNNDKNKEHTFIGLIKNTDNGILIIEKAIINDIDYEMKFSVVMDKNMVGELIVYDEIKLEIKSMYIIGKDVLGNVLKYKLVVNQEKNDIEAIYEE